MTIFIEKTFSDGDNGHVTKDHQMIGRRYGRLLVLAREPVHYAGKARYHLRCQCQCGKVAFVYGDQLRAGRVVSCGCARDERIRALGAAPRSLRAKRGRARRVPLRELRFTTSVPIPEKRPPGFAQTIHGHSKGAKNSPTFTSWLSMIQRCTNPNAPNWNFYGGRGVVVCERWREFSAFLADMGARPDGTSLDRIDSNGNYEPGNVRWADKFEQGRNRRGVKLNLDLANEALGRMEHGESMASVARRIGVTSAAIREIVVGNNWRDVPPFAGAPTWK